MESLRKIDSQESFEYFIAQEGTINIVKFSASWCSPCKLMSSNLLKVDTNKYNVLMGEVDVDNELFSEEFFTQYHIKNIPVTFFFIKGQIMDKIVGLATTDEIENKLNNLINDVVD